MNPSTIVAFNIFSIIPLTTRTILKAKYNNEKTIKKAITSYSNIFKTATPSNTPPKLKNGKFL